MRRRRQIGSESYPFGPLPKRQPNHQRFWRIVQRILAETFVMTSIYWEPAPPANTAIEVSITFSSSSRETWAALNFGP